MGRKTACDANEWHALTRTLARHLARELRKMIKGEKIDMDLWRAAFGVALHDAAQYAVDNCDVNAIVQQVLANPQQIIQKALEKLRKEGKTVSVSIM